MKVIVRARHDRCLSDSSYKLWKDVEINGSGFEVDVEIPSQRNRMDKKTKKVIDNADASEFFDKDEYEVLERIGKKKLNLEKL